MLGKVCLVTGANRGIGKEIALQLAKAGAAVMVHSRTADKAEATVAELRAAAGPGVDLFLAPGWILGGTLGAERIAATGAARVAAIHLLRADSQLPLSRALQLVRPGELARVL